MELAPEVIALWNAEPSSVQLLRRGRHHIYSMRAKRRELVLKMTPLAVRPYQTSRAIADWIEFLAQRRIPVSRALPSIHGRLVEEISTEEGAFSACAYVRAPGSPVDFTDCTVWNARLFRHWGRLLGRIHALSKEYVPPRGIRHHEMTGEFIDVITRMTAIDEPELAEHIGVVWSAIAALPRSPQTYGMLHGDVTHGNFFIRRGRLTLFDFDDAGRGWFMQDVAMALFGLRLGVVPVLSPAAGQAFLQHFFQHFLAGYIAEHPLDPQTLSTVPLFLTLLNQLHFVGLRAAPPEQRHDWFAIVEQHARAGTSPVTIDLDAAWRGASHLRRWWRRGLRSTHA